MATVEDEVKQATLLFYRALDDVLLGKGTAAMQQAWHHDDFVSTVHPFGYWARGWDEVLATWEEIGQVFSFYHGHDDRQDGIGTINELSIAVLGEVAFTTGIYKSRLYGMPGGVPGIAVNCTNVLLERDGAWKMAHHHPDQASPEFQASLEQLVASGQT